MSSKTTQKIFRRLHHPGELDADALSAQGHGLGSSMQMRCQPEDMTSQP
jgi:hypothetical protein